VQLIALVALVLPFGLAEAQQHMRKPRIGVVMATSAENETERLGVFRKALAELGYIESKNIHLEYRFADGKLDRLPELVSELVRAKVNIIVTAGNEAVQAAKNATQTIPIVMAFSGDPLGAGFIASLARPGGNITGLSRANVELTAKRLEILNETVPGATRVAVLFNREGRVPMRALKEAQRAADKLGLHIQALEMQTSEDIESAFRSARRERAGAILTRCWRVHGLLPIADCRSCGKESPPSDVQHRQFCRGGWSDDLRLRSAGGVQTSGSVRG
jgi:putative ABC transport system substrate-binding protein